MRSMVIDMNDEQLKILADLQGFLEGTVRKSTRSSYVAQALIKGLSLIDDSALGSGQVRR